MTFTYLDPRNFSTLEQLKKAYRKLAMRYHPDVCTDLDKAAAEDRMKQINAEFDEAGRLISIRAGVQDGGNRSDAEATAEDLAAYRDIISDLINLDGLEIEICGTWVWVTGQTYTHKDALKANGFKWASKKKAWYWHSGQFHKKGRRSYSMDEIRTMHKTVRVAHTSRPRLTA